MKHKGGGGDPFLAEDGSKITVLRKQGEVNENSEKKKNYFNELKAQADADRARKQKQKEEEKIQQLKEAELERRRLEEAQQSKKSIESSALKADEPQLDVNFSCFYQNYLGNISAQGTI